MEIENIFGSITMTLGIAMTVIALPSQIRRNRAKKTCGLTLFMIVLPLLVYISRATYALMIKSFFIVIPDIFGIMFSLVLLYQKIHYWSKN